MVSHEIRNGCFNLILPEKTNLLYKIILGGTWHLCLLCELVYLIASSKVNFIICRFIYYFIKQSLELHRLQHIFKVTEQETRNYILYDIDGKQWISTVNFTSHGLSLCNQMIFCATVIMQLPPKTNRYNYLRIFQKMYWFWFFLNCILWVIEAFIGKFSPAWYNDFCTFCPNWRNNEAQNGKS